VSEEIKGVHEVGKPDTAEGVKVVPNPNDKGVVILDKNSKTTPPPVEITEGEGDRDE
jgi:hypothetical protein